MTLISKAAAGASLISCIRDIHYTAKVYSKNEKVKAGSNTFLSGAISASRTDMISLKDSERKDWFMINNPFVSFSETMGAIKGYIKGAGVGTVRYIPNLILAVPALFIKKHPKIANIAALGLGILEGVDFIKNTFALNTKTDYFK